MPLKISIICWIVAVFLITSPIAFAGFTEPQIISFSADKSGVPYIKTIAKSVLRLDSGGSAVAVSPKFALTVGHTARQEWVDAFIHETADKWRPIKLKRRFSIKKQEVADFAVYEIVDGQVDTWIPIDLDMKFSEKTGVIYLSAGFPNREKKFMKEPSDKKATLVSSNLRISEAKLLGFEKPEHFIGRLNQAADKGPIKNTLPKRWFLYPEEENIVSFVSQISAGMSGGPVIRIDLNGPNPRLSVVALNSQGQPYRKENSLSENTGAYTTSHIRNYLAVFDPELLKELKLPAANPSIPKSLYIRSDSAMSGYLKNFTLENTIIEFSDWELLKLTSTRPPHID